jgi:hypothetical protein
MIRRWVLRMAVVGWAGFVAGCAANVPPTVRPAIVSEQLATAVERAQTLEIDLYQQGQLSPTAHRQWQRRFLLLGQGILALNQGIRAQIPEIRTAAIRQLLGIVQEMSETLIPELDFDQAKIWLQLALDTIETYLVLTSTQPVEGVSWIPPLSRPCYA